MKTKSLSVIVATLAIALVACADKNSKSPQAPAQAKVMTGADGVTKFEEGGPITATDSTPILAPTEQLPTTPVQTRDDVFDQRDNQLEASTADVNKHFGVKPTQPVEQPVVLAPTEEKKLGPTRLDHTRKIKVVGDKLMCTSEFLNAIPNFNVRFKNVVKTAEQALKKMQYAVDNLTSRWSSGDTSKEAGELQTAYEQLTGVTLEIKQVFGDNWACDAGNGVKFSSERYFSTYKDLRTRIGKLRGTHTLGPQI